MNVTLLTEEEKKFLCSFLNRYSTQTPIANESNLQFFVPTYVSKLFKKHVDSLSFAGAELADNILKKIA